MFSDLLTQFGSPLYVYDAERLRADIARIAQAVPYADTRFHFASVVNGNLALLRIFRAAGWGLHANTPGDVFLGLRSGFAPSEIVFSGGHLTRDEMAALLADGIHTLNLDSLAQLEQLCELVAHTQPDKTPRLGFRLNLPDITRASRTGVSVDELRAAVPLAARAGLQVSGIHFYRGTGTNATAAFTDAIAAVLQAGSVLPDWRYLDFGGGFGYPYRATQTGFGWEEFGAELSRQLNALERPIELIIEPGRAAIAGCAQLLTTVVAVKWQGERQLVGVDSSVANIAVLSVHGGHREVQALKNEDACFVSDVCGNTTFSRDYLARHCRLPRVASGDVLAIQDVGAYGYAMASHFLHRPRPAEVLIENGAARLIRRRETYDALLAQQCNEHSEENATR
jgi:diaminopimelate decarboxylase